MTMRVTLDWDDDEAMMANLERAKTLAENRGGWELRQSSSGDGYHFIAYGAVNDTRTAYRNLLGDRGDEGMRAEFGDDLKRVKLDRKRWDHDSPFQQVLYSRKYMSRADRPQYTTGNTVETINGYNVAPEEERIKDEETGRLDYEKMLDMARQSLTQRELAERAANYADDGSFGRSTVSDYERGQTDITERNSGHPLKRALRRWARSNDVGHYQDDESADETIYRDGRTRRTLVEYIDVPWSDTQEEENDYRLAQVETGTCNSNHTDGQLRKAHEEAVKRVLDRMSPDSPKNGVTLDLDRDLASDVDWTGKDLRQTDAVHYEEEVLDDGEAAVYWENLPNREQVRGDAIEHVTTEVLLWDEEMETIKWQVLLVDDGDGWRDHTVLKDTTGWWP